MSGRYRTSSGRTIEIGERIAKGAAGAAMTVRGRDDIALKLLDSPTALDESRVKAMLTIDVPQRVPGVDAVIAWPTELVFDQRGKYVGFLMARVPAHDSVTLSTLALRRERERRLDTNLGWDALLTVTANYSAAVAALHACGVVVCDINLKNAMVSGDLTVTVIDCDSTQIEVGGTLYSSIYFQHEFLAPELHGGSGLLEGRREQAGDRWALAVLIWMVLMDGHHPFAGVWSGPGEPELDDHVAAGRFPYDPGTSELEPSPEAPPWRALPPSLQGLFLATFAAGAKHPERRPEALAWVEALQAARTGLQRCSGASGRYHSFPAGQRTCPWCEYEAYLSEPPPAARAGAALPNLNSLFRSRSGARSNLRQRPTVAAPEPPAAPPRQTAPGKGFRPGRTLALVTLTVFLIAIVVAVAQNGADSPTAGGGPPEGGGGGGGAEAGGGSSGSGEAARARRRARWAPARSIRSHYTALGNGAYQRAFGFMAPSYRHGNPRWLEQAREAQPRINIIHVGKPRISGNTASVPMRFFARDTYDTVRSDTVCRRFDGSAHMVKTYEGWRYDPTKAYQVVERPGGGYGCP